MGPGILFVRPNLSKARLKVLGLQSMSLSQGAKQQCTTFPYLDSSCSFPGLLLNRATELVLLSCIRPSSKTPQVIFRSHHQVCCTLDYKLLKTFPHLQTQDLRCES